MYSILLFLVHQKSLTEQNISETFTETCLKFQTVYENVLLKFNSKYHSENIHICVIFMRFISTPYSAKTTVENTTKMFIKLSYFQYGSRRDIHLRLACI